MGIPLDYPWVLRHCRDEEIPELKQEGYTIVTQEEYDNHVASLADRYAAWESARTQLGIETVVSAASHFGQGLMITFAAENVLLGITQEGKAGEVLNKLSHVMAALQAGSLYEAMSRVRAIPGTDYDVKYITEARLLLFINRIEAYLGLPLSEVL